MLIAKAVYMENRAEAMPLWREPFVELRAPLLFNLRRDPLEKAQHNANTYDDWWLDRVYLITPATAMVGEFLMTFKDFPPSQTAGSFNLSKVQKQITVDQLRGDLPGRYLKNMGEGGYRYLKEWDLKP